MNIFNYNPTNRDYDVKTVNVLSAWGDIPSIISDIIQTFEVNTNKAIEFGVEFGYSTTALANYFDEVVGVDTFIGDIHSGHKEDNYLSIKENLKEFTNIELIQASYQEYTKNNNGKYGLAHVDIVHTYEDTYACGEWCMNNADVVIFHDTVSFPNVLKACYDLAVKYNAEFYNYPNSNGLGILVNKK